MSNLETNPPVPLNPEEYKIIQRAAESKGMDFKNFVLKHAVEYLKDREKESAPDVKTKEGAVARLKQIAVERYDDNESAHCGADEVLLDYLRANGAKEVADAFEKTSEDVGGFWYA